MRGNPAGLSTMIMAVSQKTSLLGIFAAVEASIAAIRTIVTEVTSHDGVVVKVEKVVSDLEALVASIKADL